MRSYSFFILSLLVLFSSTSYAQSTTEAFVCGVATNNVSVTNPNVTKNGVTAPATYATFATADAKARSAITKAANEVCKKNTTNKFYYVKKLNVEVADTATTLPVVSGKRVQKFNYKGSAEYCCFVKK